MAKQANTQDEGRDSLPREIGNPARRAISVAGYTRLEELDGVSEKYLLGLHGVGPRAIRLLKVALADQGLSLAD